MFFFFFMPIFSPLPNMNLLKGGIHGWGTTFGCLTLKGLN